MAVLAEFYQLEALLSLAAGLVIDESVQAEAVG